jgi:DNA-directed RNA polymerase specialized sigma24 family protein
LNVQVKDLTYRHVAIMLSKSLPIDGEDFSASVNANLEAIKRLPQPAKLALKSAYIFSQKVPREEREDLFQDITLALLKAKTNDEKLAYAIARCDWKDFWKKYRVRQHYSLDTVTENEDGDGVTLGEMILGEAEFEAKMDGALDAKRIWESLPDNIKPIVTNRLIGKALTHHERNTLNYWVKAHGYKLLLDNSAKI